VKGRNTKQRGKTNEIRNPEKSNFKTERRKQKASRNKCQIFGLGGGEKGGFGFSKEDASKPRTNRKKRRGGEMLSIVPSQGEWQANCLSPRGKGGSPTEERKQIELGRTSSRS